MRRLVLIAVVILIGTFAGRAGQTDAAHARKAKAVGCTGPCIATMSGFGALHWPNSRKDLSFTTPRSFGVAFSYSRCEKGHPGLRLTLHAHGDAVPLVVRFEATGHGTATWNAGHNVTWKPQVVSRCRWSFTITAMSAFDATPNPATSVPTAAPAGALTPTGTAVPIDSVPSMPSAPAHPSAPTDTPVPTATPDVLNVAC